MKSRIRIRFLTKLDGCARAVPRANRSLDASDAIGFFKLVYIFISDLTETFLAVSYVALQNRSSVTKIFGNFQHLR